MNPIFYIDFYKSGHIYQYPKGLSEVYSNLTPRSTKLFKGSSFWDGKIKVFGIEAAIKKIILNFDKNFFGKGKPDGIADFYQKFMGKHIGEGLVKGEHIQALLDLGYLPIEFKALPEGSIVDAGTPIMTMKSTHPDFAWLVNYLETYVSCEVWKPTTIATIARDYKNLFLHYAEKTGTPTEFCEYQGHDFSMRGMSGIEDSINCGLAWLSEFDGTDNVAAALKAGNGLSIPATEHSVMCAGGRDSEFETYERLITEIYPNGMISIVSDTWDFWSVLTDILPKLKDKIMSRNGKVVIRPDSGDPVDIVCGNDMLNADDPAHYGAVEVLWNIFGGKINEKGYKELDSHIGLIYGDSITIDRAEVILAKLEAKGFSSGNIVFGIGSYTMQYVTRDTLGFAVKATSVVIDGERKAIFKDPKTGSKKSHKGLLMVDENFVTHEMVTEGEEKTGMLKII